MEFLHVLVGFSGDWKFCGDLVPDLIASCIRDPDISIGLCLLERGRLRRVVGGVDLRAIDVGYEKAQAAGKNRHAWARAEQELEQHRENLCGCRGRQHHQRDRASDAGHTDQPPHP